MQSIGSWVLDWVASWMRIGGWVNWPIECAPTPHMWPSLFMRSPLIFDPPIPPQEQVQRVGVVPQEERQGRGQVLPPALQHARDVPRRMGTSSLRASLLHGWMG